MVYHGSCLFVVRSLTCAAVEYHRRRLCGDVSLYCGREGVGLGAGYGGVAVRVVRAFEDFSRPIADMGKMAERCACLCFGILFTGSEWKFYGGRMGGGSDRYADTC